jgi:hypothetical protein
MIDVTHAQNGAWDTVWQGGKGARGAIPYELALDNAAPQRDQLLQIAQEQTMYKAALQSARQADAY